MEYRVLGRSGLRVPALSFGTTTFGGVGDFYRAWGSTDIEGARRLIDICLDAGVCLFDTADVYSAGASEEILGAAVVGRRDQLLISTKTFIRASAAPNDVGLSRHHIVRSCEASLRRLKTDYVDIYTMHSFDGLTATEETLRALDHLVDSGKVRYLACSNFSGWQVMKSLAISDRYGWNGYVAHQVYYSLVGREYEWELMPLAVDQNIGAIVWSPLGCGRLTGRIRRGEPLPERSRLRSAAHRGPPVVDELLYRVVDALTEVSHETGKSVPQVALNWVLYRPTVSSVIVGARDESQLRENLDSLTWRLTGEQVARLDAASRTDKIYPYWHQHGSERQIFPV